MPTAKIDGLMRPANPFTDKRKKTAKPGEKPVLLFDGAGLYLEVATSGSKLWRMKFRHGGNTTRMAFGKYPDVSLAEAREKRQQIRKQLAAGLH